MPRRQIPRPPGTRPDGPIPLAATGRPLRWGVVSTGRIAATMSAALARLDDAVLHAVSSRDPDRAAAFAREHGFATSYGDAEARGYERLADDPDVDVVYVATPHAQHHQVARAALAAGKHALVEKAFTINAREAEDLAALARERGVFVMEAVFTRFLPVFHGVLDVVRSGELGEVRWLQADIGFNAVADARSRLWEPESGGGALLDLTVYPLTWALGVLGLPRSLTASAALTAGGVDASNAITLSYDDGAHVQLLSTLAAQTTRMLTIAGTEGTLTTRAPLTGPAGFSIVRGDDEREVRFGVLTPKHAYQLREVTRCVQEGLTESPTMPMDDTVATMRLFDEARRQMGVAYANDAA